MVKYVIWTLFLFNSLFMGHQNTKETAKKQAIKTAQNDNTRVISKHFNNNPSSRIEWKIPVVRNDEGKHVRQGTAVRYTATGKIAEKVPYKMNKKDGKQLSYSPNGKVYLEQTYKNGKLNGECKLYDMQGI